MKRLFILLLIALSIGGCGSDDPAIALGTLERDRIAHTATAAEVVVELPVAPGSRVKAGDLLVRLDDTLQAAQAERAEALVAQAQAKVDKLHQGARPEELAVARAAVAGARAALVEATASYQRILNLRQQKLASQAELDKARAARDASEAALNSSEEALLALTNGTREEDLRAADAELSAARASLEMEQKRLRDLEVLATRDGILDNLPWNLGERVTLGSPLAIVLAGTAPFARVYVPEPYRVQLKVGDALRVRVDGLEQPIVGQLRWIASEPAFTPHYALNQSERARLVYRAEIQLPDSAAALPNGLPAQVELPSREPRS